MAYRCISPIFHSRIYLPFCPLTSITGPGAPGSPSGPKSPFNPVKPETIQFPEIWINSFFFCQNYRVNAPRNPGRPRSPFSPLSPSNPGRPKSPLRPWGPSNLELNRKFIYHIIAFQLGIATTAIAKVLRIDLTLWVLLNQSGLASRLSQVFQRYLVRDSKEMNRRIFIRV